jgi:hypothetical protein
MSSVFEEFSEVVLVSADYLHFSTSLKSSNEVKLIVYSFPNEYYYLELRIKDKN